MLRFTLAACAAVFPLSAAAQEAPAVETCAAVVDLVRGTPAAFGQRLDTPLAARVEDGWCVVDSLALIPPGDFGPGYSADRILWRGEGLAEALAQQAAPLSFDLRVEGLRTVIRTGDPVFDYQFAVQARAPGAGISIDLSVRRDPEAQTLTVERLFADFPFDNSVSLTAQVEGLDLNSVDGVEASLPTVRLTTAEVEVETNGLFEHYMLPALVNSFLPASPDPAAEVEALKAQARAAVAALSAGPLSDASADAALRLIEDMPNPAGRVRLSIDAPQGIGMAQLALLDQGAGLAALLAALEGVAVGVSYEP